MNHKLTGAFAALSFIAAVASAGTVSVPKDKPAVTVEIPDAWKPENIENGIVLESPDKVATLYMEVTSAKAADDLLKENMEYLQKEQGVTVDMATQKVAEAKIGGQTWHRMSFEGTSKEFGAAEISFSLFELPGDKVITVTCWVNKKDKSSQEMAVDVIMDSIKPVK
jgi:hypothetical protein